MPERVRGDVLTFTGVYLALLGLLALTVGLALLDLGIGNPVAALAIAAAKALLIAIFFMHLRRDDPVVRLAAVVGLAWLSLLLGLVLADYLTRPAAGLRPEAPAWGAAGTRTEPPSRQTIGTIRGDLPTGIQGSGRAPPTEE